MGLGGKGVVGCGGCGGCGGGGVGGWLVAEMIPQEKSPNSQTSVIQTNSAECESTKQNKASTEAEMKHKQL